jgi:hypothetical protein
MRHLHPYTMTSDDEFAMQRSTHMPELKMLAKSHLDIMLLIASI